MLGIYSAAMSMLDYVLAQLQVHKGRWTAVAEETGVSKRTIEKIASGEITDPRVSKVEKLAAYFRAFSARTRAKRSELRV